MMNIFKYLITSCFAIVLVMVASNAKAQYISEEKVIVAKQPVTVSVPNAEALTIVYRPGSNISDTVRISPQANSYQWMPREAGLVTLSIPDGSEQTVSVRFDVFPTSGYIILFGAAFILFGGALFASYKLFGKETPEEIAARPDT